MNQLLAGRYEVIGALGSGAMGQVLRARDTRLGRDVALKMLPTDVASDPGRIERFRREAHVLARLRHANIASIYDLEEADGSHFLVLEYVPGRTLAERLREGPLPIEEGIALARQLAEALEAAHGQGCLHRDLKPANLVLTPEGSVKVLDFGLAKTIRLDGDSLDPWEPSALTAELTADGALLGTVGYMSPEQVRGQPLDRRTDIWAYGCILYEVFSGRRAFRGASPGETLAMVLERDPDWSVLPRELPPHMRLVIERCLMKDPRHRLRDIGDAWIEIDQAPPGGSARRSANAHKVIARGFPVALGLFLGLVTALAVVRGPFWKSERSSSRPRIRFEVDLPPQATTRVCPSIALSRDGAMCVIAASNFAGSSSIWIRRMDEPGMRALAVPHVPLDLCFSPDGRWVAFGDREDRLVRMLLSDGNAVTIGRTASSRGLAWGPDDSLLFAPGFDTGLWRMSARGGPKRPLTTLDSARGEVTHRWPEILPGGQWALFTVRNRQHATFDQAEIVLVSLRTGERRTLMEGGTNPRYSRSGHIVFARTGRLLAVPFDLKQLRMRGTPFPVVENVDVNPTTGAAQFALSAEGTLCYVPASAEGWTNRLAWVDARGDTSSAVESVGAFMESPQLSRDGRKVAITLDGAQNEIGVYDLRSRMLTRLTFHPDEDVGPLWTTDGRRIVFSSSRDGALNLYWLAADGSETPERLTRSPHAQAATAATPDGSFIIFVEDDPETGKDIWMLPLGDRRPRPFRRTAASERAATLSPDGRWLAYESDETGRVEIFVESFPRQGGRWQISEQGGVNPQWSPASDRLYFCARGTDWMVAQVSAAPSFRVSRPRTLFSTPLAPDLVTAPDGRRFIANTGLPPTTRLAFAVGWDRDLDKSGPRRR